MPEVMSKSATEIIMLVVESGQLHDNPIACIACSNSRWWPVQNECASEAKQGSVSALYLLTQCAADGSVRS